jgi:phosphoribosyl-ATP pyrophosphohydrolase
VQEQNTFTELEKVLLKRKSASAEESYVASLYQKGLDHILKKIGEESSEVIIAAKSERRHELIKEMADLWFHCMVLLVDQGVSINDVCNELDQRFGISGLEAKATRKS